MLLLSPKGVSQWGRRLGEAAPGGKSGGNVFQVLYITCLYSRSSPTEMPRCIPNGQCLADLTESPVLSGWI